MVDAGGHGNAIQVVRDVNMDLSRSRSSLELWGDARHESDDTHLQMMAAEFLNNCGGPANMDRLLG